MTVTAGFTRTHVVQPAPDTTGVNLTDPRVTDAAAKAQAAREDLFAAVESINEGKHPMPTWDDVDKLYYSRESALREVETAIRAANPGATQAAIMAAARTI